LDKEKKNISQKTQSQKEKTQVRKATVATVHQTLSIIHGITTQEAVLFPGLKSPIGNAALCEHMLLNVEPYTSNNRNCRIMKMKIISLP